MPHVVIEEAIDIFRRIGDRAAAWLKRVLSGKAAAQ